MPHSEAQGWQAFKTAWHRGSWDEAVAWLRVVNLTPEQKAAILRRAAQENLDAISISQRDLTKNRRRPGAFE